MHEDHQHAALSAHDTNNEQDQEIKYKITKGMEGREGGRRSMEGEDGGKER